MSNAIQLDLFHGKVLTVEQQEEVNRFIKNQAERAIKAEKRNSKIMLMLDEAGFVYGQDYSSNFEVEEVTKENKDLVMVIITQIMNLKLLICKIQVMFFFGLIPLVRVSLKHIKVV